MNCLRRCLLIWGIVCLSDIVAEADLPQRPNVLFIAIDDMNDWCSVMQGHPQARTPNLDRLAARGMFFDRAYCAAPACNPSRVSVLTGIRPSTSGMYLNSQKFREVLPDAVTLPQYFSKQGYRVAGGGKVFHHGNTDPASWPEYFDQPKDPLPSPLSKTAISDVSGIWTWQPLDVPDETMGDAKVARWGADWLKKHGSEPQPFFLAVGFYRPHMPLHVPRRYFEAFPRSEVTLPAVLQGDVEDLPAPGRWLATHRGYHKRLVEADEWHDVVRAYLASILFMDVQLGKLIDALDTSPARDNTIVVLWSDHGWHLGEKEHWSKFALWEQSTRVPCLMVVPGMTRPGSRCTVPVSLLDLYPTLVELCGLPRPDFLEGTSLVPLLSNPQANRESPVLMTYGPNNHAIRDARWRYIRYFDGSEELYDHESDPREWTNLAGDSQHRQTIQRLAEWIPKVNRPLEKKSDRLPPGN